MKLGKKNDRTARLSTKRERITIDRTTETVEVDLDFTQMYNCFFYLSIGIKTASSFQILFYLLRNMDRQNQVTINKHMVQQFQSLRKQLGVSTMTEQTFYTALRELQRAGVMTKLNKGIYFLNPYAIWKDTGTTRRDYLKIDAGEGQTMAINPIDLLINAPDSEVYMEDLTDEDIKRISNE